MLLQLSSRILTTTDPRHLMKFGWNFGFKGVRSVHLFKKRLRQGVYFPPFLYLSILNSCNLRCQGCWVDVDKPEVKIDLDDLHRLVNDAKAHGNAFFGILGGEPFLHPGLLDFLAAHPDCFFQIFTNGQLITEKTARQLRALGNATPLISIEGTEIVSDERRGKPQVLERTLRGLDHCIEQKLLTGVATSLCQTNIDDLLQERWLRSLIDRGVHYAWYHSYRPVGPRIHPELALTREQARRVRRFVVEMRAKLPIGIIDAYYDHQGKALCPMATGISHHVSPGGDIEPCPIIQFATESIRDPRGLFETMTSSAFLKDFRDTAARHTRGCIVLERPDLVTELALKHGARDTTIRQTALAEVNSMEPRTSQYQPDDEIPEKHWLYRWGKRLLFNDFGAYSRLEPHVARPTHPPAAQPSA
ncbi:MAG TPA: radical SAM protein [Verrucomicrobiales bacterium]|nr:radical SAM protein [Verrucomicrobiales bacterium]